MMRNPYNRSAAPLLVIYVCLAAMSVGMIVLARDFPGGHMGAAGPGFFPQVVAGLLLLLCLLGALELGMSAAPTITRVPAPVFVAMALSLGYVGLMIYIGYYPSTFLFAFSIMALIRKKARWSILVIDSVIITLCAYLFFEIMVDAYLPVGAIFE